MAGIQSKITRCHAKKQENMTHGEENMLEIQKGLQSSYYNYVS